jgi:hypothetical protein
MKTNYRYILSSLLTGLLVFTPPAHAKKDKHAQQPIVSLQGKVVHYLINPFGEIDGLFLDSGTLVKVPPHMSNDVGALVRPGDAITLQGTPDGDASFEAYSITNTKSNQTLLRREPAWNGKVMPKHLRAAGLKEINADGKIERVIAGKRGEPKIVILEDGANIRLPKDTAYGAYSLISVGAPFAASGYGTENQYGRSLEATAIGTNLASLKPLFGAFGPPH